MSRETTESSWLYELLAWVEVNRKRLIVAGISLIVVIMAIYVYVWMRGQTQLEASRALYSLKPPTQRDTNQVATPADYLKVAHAFPDTSAGQQALLLAAVHLFGNGHYAQAQAQFQAFLDQYSSSPFASTAALGVATCLDAQNKVSQARQAYQSVLDHYPNDAATIRAKFALAALDESQNKPEQALQIYDELNQPQRYPAAAMEANVRRQRLLQIHPDLATTNAPPSVKPAALKVKPLPAKPAAEKAVTNQSATAKSATNQAKPKTQPVTLMLPATNRPAATPTGKK